MDEPTAGLVKDVVVVRPDNDILFRPGVCMRRPGGQPAAEPFAARGRRTSGGDGAGEQGSRRRVGELGRRRRRTSERGSFV